jgi:hypothetical protein
MGRRVRTFTASSTAGGPVPMQWDLRDDRGVVVAAGWYLLRAQYAGSVYLRRIVVIR